MQEFDRFGTNYRKAAGFDRQVDFSFPPLPSPGAKLFGVGVELQTGLFIAPGVSAHITTFDRFGNLVSPVMT